MRRQRSQSHRAPQAKREAQKATPQDRTLVSSKLTKFIAKGLSGDLSLESFNAHYKEYNKLVRNKPPATRPSDEETMEMLISIVHKDPSVRDLFELKLEARQPDTLDAVIDLIRSTLHSRLVAGGIDEVTSDSAYRQCAKLQESCQSSMCMSNCRERDY